MCMMSLLSSQLYSLTGAKYWIFKQNLDHNRSGRKDLPERVIGDNKSKIDPYLKALF